MMLATTCAALLLAAVAGQEQPRLSARLSAETGRVGETILLEVSVQNTGKASVQIIVPPFPAGLAIVGTQDFSEYQFSIPGGRNRTTRREIAFQATAAGSYTIPVVRV